MTMKTLQAILAAFVALSVAPSYGFAPVVKKTVSFLVGQKIPAGEGHSGSLNAVLIADPIEDEVTSRYLMSKARECAYSDGASSEDARRYLHEILHIQSACVSGALAGHDLCGNVDEIADVVAHLREKAKEDQGEIDRPLLAETAAASIPATFVTIMCIALFSAVDWGQGATPLTLQEWLYAAKGGYLHTMLSHFLRNGGL